MNRRLYRSRRDRMLAGVAGGLAEMWDADPSLVRIVWALLVIFTGGAALLVYLVMAVVVPEEDRTGPPSMETGAAPTAPVDAWSAGRPAAATRDAPSRGGPGSGALLGGGLLIALGLFLLVREYLPAIDFDWLWPLALIGLGALLLVSATRRDRPHDGT